MVKIREIKKEEIPKLLECIQALSEYHNQVSVNFKGFYPSRSYEKTLLVFEDQMERKISRIAAAEENGRILGFCKIDREGGRGKLDYLVVLEEFRGRGCGGRLMDWAMEQFREYKVSPIEVKVADGNAALHLYERYGFKMNAHILWKE